MLTLDENKELEYNKTEAAEDTHPILAEWINQLLGSKKLRDVLSRWGDECQIDVTLSSSRGRAVLSPKITIR